MQFCPKCKSMMFPVQGVLKCKKCGHVLDKKEEGEAFVSKSKRDKREVIVLDGNEAQGLPTTQIRCPECGHNIAYWWLRQLRSADESETRFLKCVKCGATWREYD